MSRDDAPNFRHIPNNGTCFLCRYLDQWGFCTKHEFFISRIDFYLCDDWKDRNETR